MRFEYLKIRHNDEQTVLICDQNLLPQTLKCLTKGEPHRAIIETRLKLSTVASGHFEALADIGPVFDRTRKPDASGKYPRVFPIIKFPLDTVRYAISNLVFTEAERLGRALRKRGHTWQQYGPDAMPCPPVDVDDAIDWIIHTERLIRKKGTDGVELRGTPDEMHGTLATILQDNINHQLYSLQNSDSRDDDDFMEFA